MRLLIVVIVVWSGSALAQKVDVKIVDRQDNETYYTYFVPSHFSSQSASYGLQQHREDQSLVT